MNMELTVNVAITDLPEVKKKIKDLYETVMQSAQEVDLMHKDLVEWQGRALRAEAKIDSGAWPTDWATRLVQAKLDERKRILEFLSGYFGALGINLNVNHFISLLEE